MIASHLPERFLPSGFLGVDVFFAISGYVVTASLLGQRRTGLIQLHIGFLSRRVKRLLPALALCVAVTGFVVLAADPFPRHSIETGLAALFGFANILLFFFELDYFSPSSLFNAFTHTWSLGVEEQFYVVFPLFTWLFYFRTHRASFRPLAWAMILGSLVSMTLFALLYAEHQAAAFFLMPTRIWELGIGALVFLATARMQASRLLPLLRRLAPFSLAGLPTIWAMGDSHSGHLQGMLYELHERLGVGVSLVITGPPPIFPFEDVRECSLDERESCRLERATFAPLVEEVLAQLESLRAQHPNITVFGIYGAACPAGDSYCYPDNGSSFVYRDRDHFNSLGSRRLAEPFVDLLRSSGLVTRG